MAVWPSGCKRDAGEATARESVRVRGTQHELGCPCEQQGVTRITPRSDLVNIRYISCRHPQPSANTLTINQRAGSPWGDGFSVSVCDLIAASLKCEWIAPASRILPLRTHREALDAKHILDAIPPTSYRCGAKRSSSVLNRADGFFNLSGRTT